MVTFERIIENPEYMERVIKHFRLPVRLTLTKEKFDSYLEFLQATDPDQYYFMVKTIEEDFNKLCEEQGTQEPDFSFESVVDKIVEDFENEPAWKEFVEKDYSNSLDGYTGVTSTHGLYAKENHRKNFVSIDLVSANWQSLQTILGFDNEYSDLVKDYTDYKIPVLSKTFRTKISGVLGAKKIMEFNKHLLNSNQYNILKILSNITGIKLSERTPFAFYADEFLIELSDEELAIFQSMNFENAKNAIKEETGVKVHIRPFKLLWLDVEKSCIKKHGNSYDVINISKDILFLINKLTTGFPINAIDFEKVKLGRKNEGEYLQDLVIKLRQVGLL